MKSPHRLTFLENVRFHHSYLIPIVVRGALAARPFGTRLLALHCDPLGERLFTELRARHSTDLFSLRSNNGTVLGFDPSVLVLDHQLAKQVLDDAESFDTGRLSRRVFERFVPKALITSDSPSRAPIRCYTEERLRTGCVIDQDESLVERLRVIVSEESKVPSSQRTINWETLSELAARITTRVVFGRLLQPVAQKRLFKMHHRLVCAATFLPGWRSLSYDNYRGELDKLVNENSGIMGSAAPDVDRVAQATYWIHALKDALDTHLPRTLALLSAYPDVYEQSDLNMLTNALHETLRLWSGTPMLVRECRNQVSLGQFELCEGTQVLLPLGFLGRDQQAYGEDACRFRPQRWDVRPRPPMLHFSTGPRGCAGRELVIFILVETLASLLKGGRWRLEKPALPANGKVPPLINQFKIVLKRDTAHTLA